MTTQQKQLIAKAVRENINFIVNKNFSNRRVFISQCIKSRPSFTQEMAKNIYNIQFVNL